MKNLSPIRVGFFSMYLSAALFAQTSVAPAPVNKSQPGPARAAAPAPSLCAACIRANMEFLASDALRGRGSGTADELVAATYVASQLRAYGITPAGDNGGYLQRGDTAAAKIHRATATDIRGNPAPAEKGVTWTCGKEFAVLYLAQTQFSGPLHVINADEDDPQPAGAIVSNSGKRPASSSGPRPRRWVTRERWPRSSRPRAERAAQFQKRARKLPTLPVRIEGARCFRPGKRFQPAGGQSGSGGHPESASGKYNADVRWPLDQRTRTTPGMRSACCAAATRACNKPRCCSRPISITWESGRR